MIVVEGNTLLVQEREHVVLMSHEAFDQTARVGVLPIGMLGLGASRARMTAFCSRPFLSPSARQSAFRTPAPCPTACWA
jgi:hypothetical protein